MSHPDILQHSGNTSLLICEDTLATACITYLRQRKYSKPLLNTSTDGEQWATEGGEDIDNHHLLRYSSKYWDKHLDSVTESPDLRTDVFR